MTSRYQEVPPPAHLRPWVQCLWTLELPTAVPGHRVLPDGCIDILFESTRTGGTGTGELYVVGMMTRPLLVTRAAATAFTAVRFKPGAAAAFLREPLHRLTDERVDLRDLWGEAGALREQLAAAPHAAQRVGLLVKELERRLDAASRRGHAACSDAVRRLAREPETGVQDLCAHLGVSRQGLARSFREHVGVSPKTLGRVLRLQHALRLLESGAGGGLPRWVDVAMAAGYYDQSHLIAEWKELVGLTPSAYLIESGREFPFFQDSPSGRG